MRNDRRCCFWWIGVPLLLLLMMTVPAVEPGVSPGLTGFYDFGSVTEQNDEVWVRLTFKIINTYDHPVYDAALTVEHPYVIEEFGTLWAGVIDSGGSVLLDGDFLLPAWMFEGFKAGSARLLRCDFTDASGNAMQKIVDLELAPLDEEE